MTTYKAGLYTNILSQVISSIESEYLPKLFLIHAGRWFDEKKTKHKRLLPFLSWSTRTLKAIRLRKESESPILNSEWKKIIKTTKEEGFGDIQISSLGFLVENTALKMCIEDTVGKEIAPTKFVVIFKSNVQAAKEEKISRKLLVVMGDVVRKLGLKYASLELNGIYTLQDWRTKRKYNLLTTEKINLEKETIKDIIEMLFKETIRISGADMKIRFVKWYEKSKGDIIKLAGVEDI